MKFVVENSFFIILITLWAKARQVRVLKKSEIVNNFFNNQATGLTFIYLKSHCKIDVITWVTG